MIIMSNFLVLVVLCRIGKIILKGPKVGRLFSLCISPSTYCPIFSLVCVDDRQLNKMWHNRLGHPNFHVLSTLFKSSYLGNKNFPISFDCTTCKLGKSKTLPFPHNASRANHCFDIIHNDVWEISPNVCHAGYKYFVTFIDDYNQFTWVYFLRSKAEVFYVFQRFVSFLKTQFSAHIKILRSDFGGEYMSNAFQSFLQTRELYLNVLVLPHHNILVVFVLFILLLMNVTNSLINLLSVLF